MDRTPVLQFFSGAQIIDNFKDGRIFHEAFQLWIFSGFDEREKITMAGKTLYVVVV